MTINPLERSYSLEIAEATLINELNLLDYDFQFQLAGKFVHTCRCLISDKKTGVLLASGNGKGELQACRIGSLFEATEHLFSQFRHINSNKITLLDSLSFCNENSMCDTLPLAILKSTKNGEIPFLKYQAVNGTNSCYYPLALSCPSYLDTLLENEDFNKRDSFNYERLEHYSSNSGTAIGMNKEESIIHGLLENIERTSLSKFLVNVFALNEIKFLRVIDPLTLPDKISNLYKRTEKELGCKVYIFEMLNKFSIPAFCSWSEQSEFKIGFAGYGCSLSIDHAISRSLYELAQYSLLSKCIYGFDWMKNLDDNTLSQLKGLPFHQACAQFNLGLKCEEIGYDLINYNDLIKLKFSKNPKKYLAELTNIIYSCGEVPFASELNSVGNGISIIHTFITGEDRFFTVRNGKTSFPISL